jgi:hypothetical protein
MRGGERLAPEIGQSSVYGAAMRSLHAAPLPCEGEGEDAKGGVLPTEKHSHLCRRHQENVWQFMRQNWLSNRIFKSFDDIVDHCCYASNTLIDQPWKIMSIARREWASVGYSM